MKYAHNTRVFNTYGIPEEIKSDNCDASLIKVENPILDGIVFVYHLA